MASTSLVEKTCVVCGLKSHRLDWQEKANPACDTHTPEEVKAALAKLAPSPAGPAKTKAASVAVPED